MKNNPKSKKTITQEDVAQAIKKFKANGGIIVKLPDQEFRSNKVVGSERYQNFESISTLIGG
ncbi:MAG: hypothetical protein HY342_01725 [Candidatus Lambdaproteobacteria bacterium]|nr:hypothetical protein [Candidatus Lambdaproteobacteria bacterium]